MKNKRYLLEGRDIIKLAWPLLIAQITQMLMGVSDTIMAGRYSATDMAAVALGFSITVPLLCFIQGIALALPPIISRLQGTKDITGIANASQQAGYLVCFVGLAVATLIPFAGNIVSLFPMADELHTITVDYVVYVLCAMPGFALYQWLLL